MRRGGVLESSPTSQGSPAKTPGAEPIPGYRLIELLGTGGFGEVWKCAAPGGIYKAVKFVPSGGEEIHASPGALEQELQALQRIKDIRHPFLLSLDRVEMVNGHLAFVMELADQSLLDRLSECRAGGLPAIPRDELLAYLGEAAEVLDVMNFKYGLQHLDIKPHNLFLVSDHVKVADFGLVQSLGGSPTRSVAAPLGGITPRYASPEVFVGRPSPFSDQYSLAITYQELLTGQAPFSSTNARVLALQHTQQPPDLRSLPEADQAVVARALAKNPEERFASCLDFLQALLAAGEASCGASPVARASVTPVKLIRPRRVVFDPRGDAVVEPATDSSAASGNGVPLTGEPRSESAIHGQGLASRVSFLQHFPRGRCLARRPLREAWETQDAKGRSRLILLYSGCPAACDHTQRAVARLRTLEHPTLPPIEQAECAGGVLALLTDPVERTLLDRFQECRSQGLMGIPREELLDHLRAAATALDDLYRADGTAHLALSPQNLLLHGDEQLRIADFGVAVWFWLPAGESVTRFNARYAAPELFAHPVGSTCDQFSLAVIYLELLAGIYPFRRRREGGSPRGKLDLDLAPASDRAILARALDADPCRRFSNCLEFIEALAAAEPFTAGSAGALPALAANGDHETPGPGVSWEAWNQMIREIVGASLGASRIQEANGLRFLLKPGGVIQYTCTARLPLAVAPYKIEGFCQQWRGRLVRREETAFVFHLGVPRSFWQWCTGKEPRLTVRVELHPPPDRVGLTDIVTQIRPEDCSREQTDKLLHEFGPVLLTSLRDYLQPNPEKRAEERLVWYPSLQVRPINAAGQAAEPIMGQGKDISHRGIGLFLPRQPPTPRIIIELPPTATTETVAMPAEIRWVHRRGDGRYEVGAIFLPNEPTN